MPSLPYGLSPVSNTSDSLSRTITKEEKAIASMPSFSPPPLSIVSNLEPSRISLSDPFDLVFQKEMAKMDTETNQKLNIIRKDEETKRMQNEEKKRIDKEEQNNWFKEKYQRDKETSLMMEEDWESEQLRDMDKKEKKYYSLPEFKSLLENPQELEDLLNEQQSLAEEIDYLAAQKDEDKLNANQIKEFKKLLKKYQQLESKIEKYKKLDIKQMRKEGYDLMTKIENKNNVFEPKEEEDIFGGGGGGPPTTRELTQRQKNLQKNNKDRQALRKTYTPLELEKRNLGELQSTAKSLGISLENVNTGKGTGKGSKRLKTKEQLVADIKKKQKSDEYYLKLNNPEEEIYVETK